MFTSKILFRVLICIIFVLAIFLAVQTANAQSDPIEITHILEFEYDNGLTGQLECSETECYATQLRLTMAQATDMLSKAFKANEGFKFSHNDNPIFESLYDPKKGYQYADTSSTTVTPVRVMAKKLAREAMGYKR